MSDSNTDALKRAYELVEAGQPEEARSILDALLATDPRNPDAWWIYAYAVDDPAEAQRALKTVLQLDPDYPEAKELMTSLQEQYPQLVEAEAVAALVEGDVPPTPLELPDGQDEPEIDSGEEPEFLPPPLTAIPEPPTMRVKKEKRTNWPLIVALVAAFILVVLAALLLRPTEPTTTTAGLATATGAEVTLEVSPLAVIDNGSGTQVSVLGLTPFATGNFPTIEGASPEATGEIAVLEVTPLPTTSGDLPTVGAGEIATSEQVGEAETEIALLPTTETTTSGESEAGSETEQVTPEGGNTVILEVTPLDATSAEQTTNAGDVAPLDQSVDATATAQLAISETAIGGEVETTIVLQVTPLDATPSDGETSAETEATTTSEVVEEPATTVETGTTDEANTTATAVEEITDLVGTATPEQTGSETALTPTEEAGATSELESTVTGTGSEGLTVDATIVSEETQPLNPDVTPEDSSEGETTTEAGVSEPTFAPEGETTTVVEATPTAESFVVEATLPGSLDQTIEPEPTAESTSEASQETGDGITGLQALEQSLIDAGITNYAITGLVTDLGNGLVVTVCAEEGPALRATLIPVMNIVAQNAPSQDARFTAVGTEVISCSNPTTTLRLIAVPRPVAEDYANGNLTNEEFEAVWRSL